MTKVKKFYENRCSEIKQVSKNIMHGIQMCDVFMMREKKNLHKDPPTKNFKHLRDFLKNKL